MAKYKTMQDGTRVIYKKKRGGKVAAGLTGGVLVGAALVYFFGNGLGMGLPSFSGVSAAQQASASVSASESVSESASESASASESIPVAETHEVRVEDDVICYDGEEVDLETLREKLEALPAGSTVDLVNDSATMATSEEVVGLLKELNITYSEVQNPNGASEKTEAE